MGEKYELLPPLTTDEFAALKADIAINGVERSIVVDENGDILDGHHRHKIDKNVKRRVVKGLSEAEKLAFVYCVNHTRRNLSPAQKKELLKAMKKVAALLRPPNGDKTQKQTAELLGVSRELVKHWETGSNGNVTNTSDCRMKVAVKEHPKITKRLDDGEKLDQVAADYGVSDRQIRTIATKERKVEAEKKERAKAVKKLGKDTLGIHHGDFRKVGKIVKDGSVDLIFTDPPYDEATVPLYGELAEYAARVLRPSGWCLAYAGQMYLPEIIKIMQEHLTWGWLFGVGHTGGNTRIRKFHLGCAWKPVVGFYKPPLSAHWDWFADWTDGSKEKGLHPWQQAEQEAAYYIESLTDKNGVVLDPCCGSGTTCVAAKNLQRKWIGFDIDQSTAESARIRIKGAA